MKKLLFVLPLLLLLFPQCSDLRVDPIDNGLLMGVAADPTLSAVETGLFLCTTLDHDTLPPAKHPNGRSITTKDPHSRSVTVNGKLWPVGKTLTVKLTGGTAQQLAYVRQAVDSISKWVTSTSTWPKISPVTTTVSSLRLGTVDGLISAPIASMSASSTPPAISDG